MKTADATVKTWEKSKLQNLVRHRWGRYYARLFLNGKEIWKSMTTADFSVAEVRLAAAQKEHRERRSKEVDTSDARMTFGQAATLHVQRLKERVTIKERTREYWQEIYEALLRSWPELETTEVRKITPAACRNWAAKNAKTGRSTRHNNSIALIINVAIEKGIVFANPATGLDRKAVKPKKPQLPSKAQFAAFIGEMRNGHSRVSRTVLTWRRFGIHWLRHCRICRNRDRPPRF